MSFIALLQFGQVMQNRFCGFCNRHRSHMHHFSHSYNSVFCTIYAQVMAMKRGPAETAATGFGLLAALLLLPSLFLSVKACA